MQARAGNVLCLSALLSSDRIDVWCATPLGRRKTNVEMKTQHVSTNNGKGMMPQHCWLRNSWASLTILDAMMSKWLPASFDHPNICVCNNTTADGFPSEELHTCVKFRSTTEYAHTLSGTCPPGTCTQPRRTLHKRLCSLQSPQSHPHPLH